MAMASNIVMNNTPAPGNVNTGATYRAPTAPVTIDYNGSSAPQGTSTNGYATVNRGSGSVASPYAVLTSQPATQNINAITTDYNQNIKPNIQATQQNNQAQTQLQSQVPTMPGYNISATKTGGQGETPLTVNGQTYYATPQNPGLTSDQVQGIISGGSTSTTETPVPVTPTPAQTAQTQTGVNPSTEAATYGANLSGINDEVSQAYKQFNDTIQTIASGSFPLTGAQQSLVDATNAAFQQMNNQAQLKAAALSSETGGVANKINAMAGQLTNIASNQAAAISKLETGFEQDDYKMISDAYTQFKDMETQKMTALTDAHNAVMATYNSALDAAQKQATLDEQTRAAEASERLQQEGTYSVVTNPDGTQSIFNNKTGQIIGSPNNAVLNGSATPGKTGIPILDNNTQTTSTGVPYIDGSNLTGKQADVAQLEAAKIGIPYMGKTQVAALQKIQDARDNIAAINDYIEPLLPKDAAGRDLGGALSNNLSSYLQTNDDISAFNTWRTAAIGALQALAGGSGSGLRINQAEIKMSLANDIPQTTDTVGVAQKKFGIINTLLDNAERSMMGKAWDKYNPNSPSSQASNALDSIFSLSSSSQVNITDPSVSSAFSNIGI